MTTSPTPTAASPERAIELPPLEQPLSLILPTGLQRMILDYARTAICVDRAAAIGQATEMEMLRREVYESMCQVQAYRAGNAALMEALMHEHAAETDREQLRTDALLSCGMLDAEGQLQWAKLAERKNVRWTWQECVRRLVKDPATVEHLLRLDDDDSAAGSTTKDTK